MRSVVQISSRFWYIAAIAAECFNQFTRGDDNNQEKEEKNLVHTADFDVEVVENDEDL